MTVTLSQRASTPWSRLDTFAITLVTAIAAALRAPRLSMPPFIYSDELFYAREACNYVYRSRATCGIALDAVSGHPPLGKLLISLGVRVLGWQPIGWRAAGLLAGTATVALLYVMARRLLGSTRGATLAAGLLAIDFLHIVQSRIAMLDVLLTLFVVASFLCVVLDRQRPVANSTSVESTEGGRGRGLVRWRPWLLVAGLAAGAAMATKWVGLLALIAVAILSWIWDIPTLAATARERRLGSVFWKRCLTTVVAMGVLPALVYTASYVPSIEGDPFALPWAKGSWIRAFARVQRDMVESHRSGAEVRYLAKTNPFVSAAWSWPLLKRPFAYYSAGAADGKTTTIMAMGNPVAWWGALLALAYLGVRLARGRHGDAELVAVVGFLALYAPFLLVTSVRSAMFFYYMLPSVPFMCLALATVGELSSFPVLRRATVALSVAAMLMLVFFYPILTGLPLSREARDRRLWFRDCRPAPGILAPAGWCWTSPT